MVMSKRRMPIRAKLKELRELAGLTQQELAIKSGLAVSSIAQIEQGMNHNPRMNTLKALALGLGVSLDELTELHTEPPPVRKPRRRPKGKER
jgi:transcriptional regulator with XRE-family HTH domain